MSSSDPTKKITTKERNLSIAYHVGILLTVIVSFLGWLDWSLGNFSFLVFDPNYKPPAPLSSIFFMALCAVVFLRNLPQKRPRLEIVLRVISMIVLFVCLFICVRFLLQLLEIDVFDIESLLVNRSITKGGLTIGRMSPLTAFLLALTAASDLGSYGAGNFERPNLHRLSQILCSTVLFFSSILVIGYIYKTPLLYGGEIIPVSLTTSICFGLLSGAMLFENREAWFHRWMMSRNLWARLTRRILPFSTAIILLGGWVALYGWGNALDLDQGLVMAVTAIVNVGLITVLTVYFSRQVQHRLKKTEWRLQEAMDRYQSIERSALDGFFLINSDGRLLKTNDTFCEMTKYTKDALLAMQIRDLDCQIPAPERQERMEKIRTVGWDRFETKLLRSEGTVIDVEISAVQQAASDLIMCFAKDVTKIKRDNEWQRKLGQKLRQTQKFESLADMAKGFAHDLKNYLQIILGSAQLFYVEFGEDGDRRSYFDNIINAATKAADLCHKIHTYTGETELQLEKVDLGKKITEMSDLLQDRVSKNNGTLHLELDPGQSFIMADASQMDQVIMNLIINASEAFKPAGGSITVATGAMYCDPEFLSEADLLNDLEPGKYIYFDVTDDGCGMDEETRARVFDLYFTTKPEGKGLGLSTVFGIIKNHRGSIRLYSEPGQGTTFKILFPSCEPDKDKGKRDGIEKCQWQGAHTIMLVDDHESQRLLGRECLKRLGCEVISASNGMEAVEIYRHNQADIDLIILDLTMPKMDGAEAMERLREIDPEVKVIIASGFSPEALAKRFENQGVMGLIQKPFTIENLRESLAYVLSEE